jgi:hypothetical protein
MDSAGKYTRGIYIGDPFDRSMIRFPADVNPGEAVSLALYFGVVSDYIYCIHQAPANVGAANSTAWS